MNSYLIHFATYTFAMIGFIGVALFIYKKAMFSPIQNKNREFLKVENALRLSSSKTIYVIKAGNEKFLIAGDTSNTTMLAKLDKSSTDNFEIYNSDNVTEIPTIKNLVQKMNNRG